MSDAIEFTWSRTAIWRVGLLNAGVAALGVPLLFMDGAEVMLLGAVWIAAFGVLLVGLFSKLWDHKPVIHVSTEGLLDRRSMTTPIAWVDIAGIESCEAENVHFVGIEFHEPGQVLRKARMLTRLTAPLHRLLRFPSLSISMSLIDGSQDALIEAIRHVRPDLVRPDLG